VGVNRRGERERERERDRKVQAGRAAPEPKMGAWLNSIQLFIYVSVTCTLVYDCC
jgi:hypothetical protein